MIISINLFSILFLIIFNFVKTKDAINSVSVSSGPSFEEEPSDSFIVRTKSATLRCKTLNALKAWFSCNTGDERSIQNKQNGHNYVDPQTGIRIIELDLEVTRNDIEEHAKAGYTTPYQCWCSAYGGHQEIISRRASILFSLNGGWSSWGSWSSCNVANKCGRGSQRRARYCSNPTPVNNGQSCEGESTQTSDCSVICSPIHGSWTSWSSWSTCSHECSQVRRRICSNPSPKYGGQHCVGHDFLIKNCTGGMCRKLDLYQLQRREREEYGTADNEQQIYLMSIIITTTFLFIFVIFIFVILRRRRYKNQGWNDADEERVGEDGQAMLLLLQQQNQQQPDLIRNGNAPEKCQIVSRLNNCNTNLLDHFVVRCDPLPSVPHTLSSVNTDIISHNNNNFSNNNLTTFNHSSASISGTPKLMPTSALSMATTTTTATITTSEEDNNESEPDYAEPIIVDKTPSPPPSKLIPTTPLLLRNNANHMNICPNESNPLSPELRQHLMHIKVSEDMMTTGYFSISQQLGVGLYIPPNAIDFHSTDKTDPQLSLYYGIDLDSKCAGVSSLSPVVILGNYGTIDLNRPIVLCIQHCLSVRHAKVPKGLSILWQENIDSSQLKSNQKWIEVLRYGEEDLNTSCYLEIDDTFIYLLTNLTGKYMFCVRKESNPKINFKNCANFKDNTNIHDTKDRISSPLIRELGLVKLLNFSLSIEQFSSTEHLLRVYIYDNIASSKINFSNEALNNRRIQVGDENTVLKLSSNTGSLCLEILTPNEGRIKGMKRVEVPLTHLWNSGPNSLLHCSFIVINSPIICGALSKLNYQIKVWQNKNNDSNRCASNVVIIDYNDNCAQNNNCFDDKKQVIDETLKLYGDSDIGLRLSLATHLDLPRSDHKDWRELASFCKFDHYLPYFASQQSPTTSLLDLWEAKLLNDLRDNSDGNDFESLQNLTQQLFKRRLIDILREMQREELIPTLWSEIDN